MNVIRDEEGGVLGLDDGRAWRRGGHGVGRPPGPSAHHAQILSKTFIEGDEKHVLIVCTSMYLHSHEVGVCIADLAFRGKSRLLYIHHTYIRASSLSRGLESFLLSLTSSLP